MVIKLGEWLDSRGVNWGPIGIPHETDILFEVFNRLTGLKERYLADGLSGREHFIRAIYEHLVEVLDKSSTVFSTLADTDVCLTLKMLVAPQPGFEDASPLVHTLVRDSKSKWAREAYRPLDDFAYHKNTAFKQIAHSSARAPVFHSDQLLKDASSGKYINENNEWTRFYGKAAVVGVPAAGFEKFGLCGFLCADSRTGSLKRTLRALATVSEHLYTVFGTALYADRRLLGAGAFSDIEQGSTGYDPAQSALSLGSWVFDDNRLIPINPGHQAALEELIFELGEIYKSEIFLQPGASIGVPGAWDLRSSPPHGRSDVKEDTYVSLGHDVDPTELVDDIWATLRKSGPPTPEQGRQALERVATYDEYGRKILTGLKKRRA